MTRTHKSLIVDKLINSVDQSTPKRKVIVKYKKDPSSELLETMVQRQL